jgi:acyl carrier protein
MNDVDDSIRKVLAEQGRLPIEVAMVRDNDDLFDMGLTSHSSVNVMLALEDAFDVEFPDALLRRATFESIAAIRGALESMGVTNPPE